jgi:colicin import membrane protein
MTVESDIKALDKRIKDLEALVKTLVAARTESKAEAAKMLAEATTKFTAATKAVVDQVKTEAGKSNVSSEDYRKIADEGDKAIRANFELQLKTERAAADAQRKADAERTKAIVDKVKADTDAQIKSAMEQQFKILLEARLARVEAMAQAALGKH